MDNNTNTLWIIILIIGVLLLALAVFLFVRKGKEKSDPNYFLFFIIGVCWIPLGFSTENHAFTAIGGIFALIGLFNYKKWKKQKKWQELSPGERKFKLFLVLFLSILLLAGIIVYLYFRDELK